MKKFIHYILPALLALSFLLSSCSAVAEKPETDTDTEAISETEKLPEDNGVYIPEDAITPVCDFSNEEMPQFIVPVTSELVYESVLGFTEDGSYLTDAKTVNIRTGETVSKTVFDGRLNPDTGAFTEDRLCFFDPFNGFVFTCKPDFTDPVKTATGEESIFGCFIPGGEKRYTLWDTCVAVRDVESGVTEDIPNEYGLPVWAIEDESEVQSDGEALVCCTVSVDNTDTPTYEAHVEMSTGRVLTFYDSTEFRSSFRIAGDGFCAVKNDYVNAPLCLYTDDAGDIWSFPTEDGARNVTLVRGTDCFIYNTDNGDVYLCRPDGNGNAEKYVLFENNGYNVFRAMMMPQSGCILLDVHDLDFSGSHLYLINPEKLTGGEFVPSESTGKNIVDREKLGEYLKIYGERECPSYLSELREEADRIEKKYGVRILLSEQCIGITSLVKDYYMLTTDKLKNTDAEREQLAEFLRILDEQLSRYPEGMLSQFVSKNGLGGIRFLPVNYMKQTRDVVGLTHQINGWYNVFITVGGDTDVMTETVNHELWHASENRIKMSDKDCFSDEKWQELNPAGFEYMNDDYIGSTDNVLGVSAPENAYFSRDYSKATASEDRATLFEEVMKPDGVANILGCEHLKAKYDCMCAALEKYFDTSTWNELPWK